MEGHQWTGQVRCGGSGPIARSSPESSALSCERVYEKEAGNWGVWGRSWGLCKRWGWLSLVAITLERVIKWAHNPICSRIYEVVISSVVALWSHFTALHGSIGFGLCVYCAHTHGAWWFRLWEVWFQSWWRLYRLPGVGSSCSVSIALGY